jgi:RNA recognition motif-containing protein
MATTIYVGNLPFESSEADVEALFAPFGEVRSIRFVIDHSSSPGQCYAFVSMKEEEAREAASFLDSMDFRGQTLVVNLDRTRERRSKRDHRRDREEARQLKRRKPPRHPSWADDDEDEEDSKDDREDDGWWGDEEDTGWYGLRGWRVEDDEAGS